MSDKTDALLKCLLSDVAVHLDPYQIGVLPSGMEIWPDATLPQAQSFALARSLLKKYNESDHPSKEACASALDKFLAVNKRCQDWELHLESSLDELFLGGVKQSLWNFWNHEGFDLVSSWDELHASGHLGSGMNIYARASDLYTKLYDGRLSCTSTSLSFVWEKLCSRDPRWSDAERLRSQRYGTHIVAGNKLSFVNKNVTVARTICTEPTLNMWYQLGLGAHLERRLSSFYGVDVRNQPLINGALAREGSLTGGFATIDLESASDSMSIRMLKEILPSNMMEWLLRLRSPVCQLPNGKVVELDMVSSMGNGFTFPLQTAVFSAVVASVYAVRGYPLSCHGRSRARNFGVFGDDIIVHSELARDVIRVLKLLGFRVNESKTFVEGPFRESCGQDFFNGSWCRGVYIKRLKTSQDAYVAINNLNRWSARTGISLQSTVGFLLSWTRRVLYVPPDEPDDAGIHVPFDMVRGLLRHQRHGIIPYQRSVAKPDVLEFKDERFVAQRGCKERLVNPSGLLLCFLHGSVKGYRSPNGITSHRISLRQKAVRYITKRRVTSSWDTLPPESRFSLIEWRPWSEAALRNLSPES